MIDNLEFGSESNSRSTSASKPSSVSPATELPSSTGDKIARSTDSMQHANSVPVENTERKFKSNNPFVNRDPRSFSTTDLSNGTLTNPLSRAETWNPSGNTSDKENQIESKPKPEIQRRHEDVSVQTYPFKTLNRILDDIKYSIPYKTHYSANLLNTKPIEYSSNLSKLAQSKSHEHDLLILNNSLAYCPSYEEANHEDTNQSVQIVRGLLVNCHDKKVVNHFRLVVLEDSHKVGFTDKHQYHIIPKSILSSQDLKSLGYSDSKDKWFDDALYKSSNSLNNHILRVTIFNSEFAEEDLNPIIDEETIKSRYLASIVKHPNLSPETIPHPLHCFKTLIKVLKGPVLLPPEDSIKTISLQNTSLDSQIDIQFLLNKLSFTLNKEKTDLVPPNLNASPQLKEEYIRKIAELIYLARIYGSSHPNNEFSTNYSYSDNLSLVFTKIPEYDKHINMVHFKGHNSNHLPFLINLSICSYFQDELIIKCFEKTVKSDSDPINKLHYVDSLKNTINFRNGSNSNSKLAKYLKNLTLNGDLVGWSDYAESMNVLGLTVDNSQLDNVNEDIIIAMYKASIKSDHKNYSYFNRHLVTIAKARGSKKLFQFIDNELLPIGMALEELGVEEITEDEVVITAYEFQLDDTLQSNGFNSSATKVIMLNKALLSIGVGRKSYLLLNYIETKLPDMIKVDSLFGVSSAYELFKCSPSSSEFDLITSFQKLSIQATDDYTDIRTLRHGLKMIAESKKSEILFSFLKNGKVDPNLLPAENWPAGLDNIGNTCYLNSLLQYYFCIKPLRELILNFNENNNENLLQSRKIGGRKVEQAEIIRSNQFIFHLQNLFKEMIQSKKRCVQPSKELAYLSFLPSSQPVSFKVEQDVNVQEIQDDVDQDIDMDVEAVQEDANDVSIIEIDDAPEKPKLLPISTDQMESTIEVGRQQDVTECIENVTYQIESALVPEKLDEDGEQIDLIKKLFYGKTKQTITPVGEDGLDKKPRISVERFFSLIINLSDHPKNIYDSLDNYFSEDLVKLEEGYVKKSLTISEMPEVLQFHVQRVMFDRERLVAYKSLEPIPFSEKIYLDRYLDTTDEDILSKRAEVFKWKSEIKHLQEKKESILKVDEVTHLNIIDSLATTKKYLENGIDLNIEPETLSRIDQQIANLKDQLTTIEVQLSVLLDKVSNQFNNYTKVGYSIFAIFIHRGEASYGHYWVYIKDPHRNVFRKYNDEIVTEVPASEVFNFNEGNTATPYYIVYVKDKLELEYVEPLKREIQK